MTDANVTLMSDVVPTLWPMAGGSGAHAAEQVGIEADRLGGTVKDGVEAAQMASTTCGSLFAEACARMVQGAMQSGVDCGNHALALLQARTPADAFRINVDFVQKQMSSMQGRLFEAAGMRASPADAGSRPER